MAGGYCDIAQVKRLGGVGLFCYRPWVFPGDTSMLMMQKSEFDNVMVRVRSRKYINLIAGLAPEVGQECYLRFWYVRMFNFALEGDEDSWAHSLEILQNQE